MSVGVRQENVDLSGRRRLEQTQLGGKQPHPARSAQTKLVPGTLDMLILSTPSRDPLHAFGLGLGLQDLSQKAFAFRPGSLFPALSCLERSDFLATNWQTTLNRRRGKYYSLTKKGRNNLDRELRIWEE
jgi:PadR family transcriptional regulator PadR